MERKKREEVVSMEWERQWGVVGGVAVKDGGWWRELRASYVCVCVATLCTVAVLNKVAAPGGCAERLPCACTGMSGATCEPVEVALAPAHTAPLSVVASNSFGSLGLLWM